MPSTDDVLSDHERTILTLFLASCADTGRGMHASMADGFLTAVISGPRLFMPSEWLPEILSLEQLPAKTSGLDLGAETAVTLLMRRHNEIALSLANHDVDMLLSVASEDDDEMEAGRLYGELWCYGYINGMSLDGDSWNPLFENSHAANALDDVYLLATPFLARDEFGKIRPDMAAAYDDFRRLTAQERSETAHNLPEAILDIYQFWRRRPEAAGIN